MKLKTISIIALSATLAIGASSCKKGCTDTGATNYNEKAKRDDGTCEYDPQETIIAGDITADETWTYLDANGEVAVYTLAGGVHVKNGATLTIEPGVIVESDPNEAVAYLLVEQGAKIMAQGTDVSPIVFTSGAATPARGDWGGIIICGEAPINKGTTATAEVGDVLYGGSNSTDDSGILEYVRVEYTGNAINSEKEHNGFTFNGVGSGTTLSYLQAYMGGDDGFEFFGGTVNASYLVSTGSKDDSFDWTYGWSGNGNYWIAEQAADEGDRGIEADNQGGANGATPFSNPTLTNITINGRGVAASSDGMKLREGTKGNISNVVIDGFKDAIEVEHDQTVTNAADGSLNLSNIKITGATNDFLIKGAGLAAGDSTTAVTNVGGAIGITATGAGTDWRAVWSLGL
ncbi:hypothetical protein N9R81_01700 [Flavobacteriales bacterium]|nr:hypothetical protein [Flavobacteriales bacterium]